jgi:galactokinase
MSTPLDQLVAQASDRFAGRFGRAPRWIVAAPGRVNIIGEHVDYNDGFVLPMAIERYCVIAAGDFSFSSSTGDDSPFGATREKGTVPLSEAVAAIYSAATGEVAAIPLAAPQRHAKRGHWSNYVAGVIAGCRERGMKPGSFQAVVETSVPIGGGLSSSASLEVATATLFEAMTGALLDPAEKALLCQRAEHEFAGVPCGIMDQFSSVMCQADHLMLLDCRSRQIEQIPLLDPRVTVLIINTNVKHELSGGEYAQRRSQCESAARKLGVGSLRDVTPAQLESQRDRLEPIEFRRARHVIGEIKRTADAAAAIKAGDWFRAGEMMYGSHDSLRDDYEVSCHELDLLVDVAREIGPAGGVIGARMTGGGFGGCTVSLVQTARADQVANQLAAAYERETGITPTPLTSRPGRGAHAVDV